MARTHSFKQRQQGRNGRVKITRENDLTPVLDTALLKALDKIADGRSKKK